MKLILNQKNGSIESLCIGDKELINLPDDLFQLIFMNDKGERYTVRSGECSDVRCTCEGKTERFFFCGFPDFPVLSVEATIDVKDFGVWFGFSFDNCTEMYLEKMQYPCFNIKDDLGEAGGKIFLPYCEGVVCEKLAVGGDEKSYPGLINMQFLSYYDNNSGLYFACEDVNCTPKIIDCKPATDGLDLIIQSFAAVAPGDSFKNSSYSVLKEFSGDWQDACELYRDFTENSGFALPEKTRELTDAPAWCEELPLVVIYPVRSVVGTDYFGPNEYFPYINGKKYLDELRCQVDNPLMALLINWEGSAPWCPPFIWPPYGGEECLSEFVEAVHKDGNYVGLYASGINWTDKSVFCPEYDMTDYRIKNGLNEIMTANPDGSLAPELGVKDVRSGYHMCPACEKTKEITYSEVNGIISSGIDYLQYFDQNCGGAAGPCYSHNHPHPPVYGSWAVDEMKNIYHGIEKIIKDKNGKCLIGGESSPSDCFLGELRTNDLRFEWPMIEAPFTGVEKGNSVPAFQYVFHEYTLNFMGNQCIFSKAFPGKDNKKSLNFRLAYSFIAGDLLTVVLKSGGEIHFDWGAKWIEPGPNQIETKDFIKKLCAMRRGLGKSFLAYGRMIKSGGITCDAVTFYGAGKTISYPAVLSSAWQDDSGNQAVMLVNHTDKPQKIIIGGEYTGLFTDNRILPPPKSSDITLEPFEVLGLIKK